MSSKQQALIRNQRAIALCDEALGATADRIALLKRQVEFFNILLKGNGDLAAHADATDKESRAAHKKRKEARKEYLQKQLYAIQQIKPEFKAPADACKCPAPARSWPVPFDGGWTSDNVGLNTGNQVTNGFLGWHNVPMFESKRDDAYELRTFELLWNARIPHDGAFQLGRPADGAFLSLSYDLWHSWYDGAYNFRVLYFAAASIMDANHVSRLVRIVGPQTVLEKSHSVAVSGEHNYEDVDSISRWLNLVDSPFFEARAGESLKLYSVARACNLGCGPVAGN